MGNPGRSMPKQFFRKIQLACLEVKHCGLVPLTQSEACACDQENIVEN